MFKELLPMVRNRKVTIIIKHNENDTLTVNVVPIQIRPDENPALCTPLSDTGVTGTAEDFDREFPQALTAYVAQHLSLAAALAQSAAEMETAKKSAADAAKQSSKDASEKWKKTKAGVPSAATPATPPAPSSAPSLFDAPAPSVPSDMASAVAPAATSLFDASPAEPAAASTESGPESDDSENADFEFDDGAGDENNEEEPVACVA